MISEDGDLYDDTENKSYDPMEDHDATAIVEVNDEKYLPPTDPDNNTLVKEYVKPYNDVLDIIV